MRLGAFPRAIFLLALTAFFFHGCAGRTKPIQPTPPEKPITAPPATAPPPVSAPAAPAKPPEISAADKLFSQGMAALAEGEQERALERFSEAWKEKPGHAGVSREFDDALIALKKSGDAALTQGKSEEAGKRWMGTLGYIQHPAANGKAYPFTRNEVKAKVDRLSASLMEKALTEYRRGGVESAIADWKTILSYDPSHEEAARSLRTAVKQLETLKKMPLGK
ncbi:MAG: hypothetical protein H6Q83_1212 [Deltaproteobacteria bacterium]|nr:hypothetical protein [Deltaproteobacteria bacterium]